MLFQNFVAQVDKKGDRTGIITTDGESCTYNQIFERIITLSDRIQLLGMKKLEPIGIAFSNSVEFVVALLANAMCQRPSVLLSTALKPQELLYHITKVGIRVILASPSMGSFFKEIGAAREEVIVPGIMGWRFDSKIGDWFEEGDLTCQFTSGANGIPKAVVRTEAAIWNEVADKAQTIGVSNWDRFLIIPPIFHSYCFSTMLVSLCFGTQLILARHFIPADIVNVLATTNVTVMSAVPFMYHVLNETLKQRISRGNYYSDFSNLRLCFSAGSPLPMDIAASFKELFGCNISQDYGSTETGVLCFNFQPEKYPQSVGTPIANRILKVFGENGQPLPAGEVGEIKVKSKATIRKYLYPDELNGIVFKDGWYATGDLGKVDIDGNVHIQGRKNCMINVAGLKVDPVEVENTIAGIPGIKEVAVVGVDTKTAGQMIKAFVVSENKQNSEEIVLHCKKFLADYKVPRLIEFIPELPRSQTGKILKKELVL